MQNFSSIVKHRCEWPERHTDKAIFHFCGKEIFEDKPYCLNHNTIADVLPKQVEEEVNINRIA